MPIISPKIPQGLEELMRGLAKSVIKENPENIYEFAAEYFENLLRERDGTVDQSYKKFATYKVYKKTKMQRKKDECDTSKNENLKLNPNTIAKIEKNVSSEYQLENSIQKIASIDSTSKECEFDHLQENEENDAYFDDKSFQKDYISAENDTYSEQMAEAALKIQSSFRGYKVRLELNENKQKEVETDEQSTSKEASISKDFGQKNSIEIDDKEKFLKEVEKNEENRKKTNDRVNETSLENQKSEEKIANPSKCEQSLDEEMAAVKIQSAFRGYKVRAENQKDGGIETVHRVHSINSIGDIPFETNVSSENEIAIRNGEKKSLGIEISAERSILNEKKLLSEEAINNTIFVSKEAESEEIENSENNLESLLDTTSYLTENVNVGKNSKNIFAESMEKSIEHKLTSESNLEDIQDDIIKKSDFENHVKDIFNSKQKEDKNELQHQIHETIQLPVEEDTCEVKICSLLEQKQIDSQNCTEEDKNIETLSLMDTDIKYKKLQESFEKNESNEASIATTNENSLDFEENKNDLSKSESGKEQYEGFQETSENIFSKTVSPFELFDEIINQSAVEKVLEIFPDKNINEDLEHILNPELVSLKNKDIEERKENDGCQDEILKPDQDDPDIPEDFKALQKESFSVNKNPNDAEKDTNNHTQKILIESARTDQLDMKYEQFASLNDPEVEQTQGLQVQKDNIDCETFNQSGEQFVDFSDPDVEQAAVKIQAAFRGHQVRKDNTDAIFSDQNDEQFVDLNDPDVEEAAVKIQAAFRGHQVRKGYTGSNSSENHDEQFGDTNVEKTVEKIQNQQVRDDCLKTYSSQLSTTAVEEIANTIEHVMLEAAVKVQSEATAAVDDLNDVKIEDAILDDAAVKIQAAFRGHQVRKDKDQLKALDSNKNDENDFNGNNLDDEELQDAAVIIQDAFKYQTQKNEKSESSISSKTHQKENHCAIETFSEANDKVCENDNTSADAVEIQESDTVEHDNDERGSNQEEGEDEEETETNDQDDDEPAESGGSAEPNQQSVEADIQNIDLNSEEMAGHKSRMEVKSQKDCGTEERESPVSLEDELKDINLDDVELQDAALKIQSTFRGQKARKEVKDKQEEKDGEASEHEMKEDNQKKEEEKMNEPSEESSSSTEKTAKELQDEEDIANLVMDDEMEKTALKIQSAFRGKFKKKTSQKDGIEEDLANKNETSDNEDKIENDEQLLNVYEYFSINDDYSQSETGGEYCEYTAKTKTYSDGNNECFEVCTGFDQTIYPDEDDDIHLMHGGGIFVEPSGEETISFEPKLASSNDENNDNGEENNDRNNEKRFKEQSIISFDESGENDQKLMNRDFTITESEEILCFNFDSKKDSAEALYYSLKKNEIEAQKRFEVEQMKAMKNYLSNDEIQNSFEKVSSAQKNDDDDDDDENAVVVIKSPFTTNTKILKFGMSMDDRLLGSILSQDYSYKKENEEKAIDSHHLQKVYEMSHSEDKDNKQKYFEEDEDQFCDFYPGNIRSKIMASSISIADSDYFDPTNNKSIIDDDTIRTALETIHSTDSESTIASAATKIQVNDRNLISRRNNNYQYSSIGNAAIDKSLDDFIQSQELRVDRFEEEPEGYCSPPPKKQESCDYYTDDTCTESDKKIAGVIEIKLEQKNFLTVDERRRTLHREDAIQRNSSTKSNEDDSLKSYTSCEKGLEKINKDSEIKGAENVTESQNATVLEKSKASLSNTNKAVKASIRRQKTMPVQIESNVIRVIPKHLRKRIKSAETERKKKFSK